MQRDEYRRRVGLAATNDVLWITAAAQTVMGFILPFALTCGAIPLEAFVQSLRTGVMWCVINNLDGLDGLLTCPRSERLGVHVFFADAEVREHIRLRAGKQSGNGRPTHTNESPESPGRFNRARINFLPECG